MDKSTACPVCLHLQTPSFLTTQALETGMSGRSCKKCIAACWIQTWFSHITTGSVSNFRDVGLNDVGRGLARSPSTFIFRVTSRWLCILRRFAILCTSSSGTSLHSIRHHSQRPSGREIPLQMRTPRMVDTFSVPRNTAAVQMTLRTISDLWGILWFTKRKPCA
jgi:hypothetical protein